jgi:hypothetical protein
MFVYSSYSGIVPPALSPTTSAPSSGTVLFLYLRAHWYIASAPAPPAGGRVELNLLHAASTRHRWMSGLRGWLTQKPRSGIGATPRQSALLDGSHWMHEPTAGSRL